MNSAENGRSRLARRAVLTLVAVVFALVWFPSPAQAQTRLDVEVGFDGRHRNGADLTVRVAIAADRLIDGELHVIASPDAGYSPTRVVVPVELSGGSTKRFVAVLPTVQAWAGDIEVQLIEGGSVLARAGEGPIDAREDELVGVLPSLSEDLPVSVPLAVDLGLARLFPIDDELLDAGPGSIDALGTVIASAADLEALGTSARGALAQWIHSGGTLLVDEPAGPVPGLEVTAATTPTGFGRGMVVATGGSLARGDWAGAIAPSPLRQNGQGFVSELTGEVSWFGSPLANALADDAGFGLPSLAVVLPAMGVYSLLAGPLAWYVLKRTGRSRWLWVALPALAAVFTALVWLAGVVQRDNTDDAHGTIIEIEAGTATARSMILRSSRSGGMVNLDLPTEWRPASNPDDQQFGRQPGVTQSMTVLSRSGSVRLQTELDAGQFALLGGTGPAPRFDDALVATAISSENGRIVGTVTNRLDVDLEEVALFAGNSGINIGTIAAGATVEFSLESDEVNVRFGEPIEYVLWPDTLNRFDGFGAPASDTTVVNISLWSQYLQANTGRARPLGQLTVAAWTDGLASPIGDITAGRTLIVAHFPVQPDGGVLTNVSGPRALLRGPDQGSEFEDFDDVNGGFRVGSAWRLDVPPGIDPATIALRLPQRIEKLRIWIEDAWLTVDDLGGGLYAIPPDAWVQNSLYVQPFVNFDQDPLLGRSFSLQTPDSGTVLRQDLFEGEIES